jgi:hypothetical protein
MMDTIDLNNTPISDQYYQQQQQDNIEGMGTLSVVQPVIENQAMASAEMHCYLHGVVHGSSSYGDK